MAVRRHLPGLRSGTLGLLCLAMLGHAADHRDSPSAIAEPAADIADIFAWTTSDTSRINFALTVPAALFSDAVQYVIAVELAATGLDPALAGDCGGRTPLYDTIDVSYTALSNDLSIPVTDSIAMDDNPNHSIDLFPFLAAPVVE